MRNGGGVSRQEGRETSIADIFRKKNQSRRNYLMDKNGKIYQTYVQTLKEELIPAMGCTEPIAIAYAAAKAREVLGSEPDRVTIGVSNNIVKNVKSVDHTGGQTLASCGSSAPAESGQTDRSLLNMADIYAFADTCDLADVRPVLDTQILYNTQISEEGLLGDYGANVGSTYLKFYGTDVRNRAIAKAAAGSDARMSGCELPVVINSGSGNQGITVSVPVIEYAKALGSTQEKLYRALVLSNLIAIHEKTGIGRLSAYCGAVSAGCAAGCAIAYLQGADLKAVSHTLVNALAIVSGIICDGAKPSCAAKIASSVEAGILGYHLYQNGQQFRGGDGIVSKGVENTIRNVGQLGRDGMRETDREIVRIMLQKQEPGNAPQSTGDR